MFSKIAPYGKAITGAVITGLGAVRLALSDDIITKGEAVDIATATLTALAVIWAIPNKDPEAQHQDESVQPAPVDVLLDEDIDDGTTYEQAGGQSYPEGQEYGDPHR